LVKRLALFLDWESCSFDDDAAEEEWSSQSRKLPLLLWPEALMG
jgi:hypothetical protein